MKKSLQMKSTAKGQNEKYSDNRLGLSLSKMSSPQTPMKSPAFKKMNDIF